MSTPDLTNGRTTRWKHGEAAPILQAASDVLVAEGRAGLSLDVIAERAGVSSDEVRGRFPDAETIVTYLVGHYEAERVVYVADRIGGLSTDAWRATLDELIDAMVVFRVADPAAMALRRAMLESPDLRALDGISTRQTAQAAAAAICRRNPALSEEAAEEVALTTTAELTSLLDRACAGPQVDEALVAQAKQAAAARLAPYLDVA